MEPLYCEYCQKFLDIVHVDGYGFGDTLLEGVMFVVQIKDNKPVCLGVKEDQQAYFEKFNKEYWKKLCEDFCESYDVFTCPDCGEDLIVDGEEEIETKPVYVGKAESALDVF